MDIEAPRTQDLPPFVTSDVYFRDPKEFPPPTGSKLILLNPGGVAIVGPWTDDCLGWHPLLKVPQSIKDRMSPRLKSTDE